MKGHKFFLRMVLVMLISSFMISCSGGSGSDKKISGESIDDPGASVGALCVLLGMMVNLIYSQLTNAQRLVR